MSYLKKLRDMDSVEVLDDGLMVDISVDSLRKWHNNVYYLETKRDDVTIFYNKGKGGIDQGKLFAYINPTEPSAEKLSINALVRLDEFEEVMELIKKGKE